MVNWLRRHWLKLALVGLGALGGAPAGKLIDAWIATEAHAATVGGGVGVNQGPPTQVFSTSGDVAADGLTYGMGVNGQASNTLVRLFDTTGTTQRGDLIAQPSLYMAVKNSTLSDPVALLATDAGSTVRTLISCNPDTFICTELTDFWVGKSSTETVNNSTTLQDDDALTMTLPNNAADGSIWAWEMLLVAGNITTTANFKLNIVSAGMTLTGTCSLKGSTDATAPNTAFFQAGTAETIATPNNSNVIWCSGGGSKGGTGTVFKLQWAQGTLTAANTTVSLGSWMHLRKLN